MTLRPDLAIIADHVARGARVLDIGCGDGALMAALRDARGVDARGLEIDAGNVARLEERWRFAFTAQPTFSGIFASTPVADADTADAATTRGSGRAPRIVPLGPGIEQYALMSSVLLDGVAYIGSRNLATTGVIAVDVAAGLVTASTTVGNGYSIQALALDPVRRLLYIGILQKSAGTAPNLFR